MDWKLLLSTFGAIFVAELGDKTQVATLSISSGSSSRWTIFVGAALALVCTSALGVLGGDIAAKFVSPIWIRRIAGVVFVAMGLSYLFRKA